MIKAIIFDCFGVLITDALQLLYQELRQTDPDSAQRISELVRASNRGVLDPAESNAQIAEILGVSMEEYRQRIRSGEVKNQALFDYARELRQSYKTAVLSNITVAGLKTRFTEHEVRDCFDVVVASGEIGYAKPEPEAYEIVANRLGVRLDECVFTDDKEDFCEAARSVGMQAIVFTDITAFKAELGPLLK